MESNENCGSYQNYTMKNLIVIVILGGLSAYFLYCPLPDGISQPGWVRVHYARGQLFSLLTNMASLLGMMEEMDVLRFHSNLDCWIATMGLTHTPVKYTDTTFDGVNVRIHSPDNKGDKLQPGMVYIHGGGWVRGRADTFHYLSESIASKTGAVIVSIDYRLAPEHKYPIPKDDCLKATVWFLQHASDYNVDEHRIGIFGDSAGGNLAAAVSQVLTFEEKYLKMNLPKLKFQGLIYPALQAVDFDTPSYQQNGDLFYLPKLKMIKYWARYMSGDLKFVDAMSTNNHTSPKIKHKTQDELSHSIIPKQFKQYSFKEAESLDFGNEDVSKKIESVLLDPYFAPLMRSDLRGLPPAYVLTAQFDVLRDDGILYAKNLEKSGVDVTWHNYEDGFHSIIEYPEGPFTVGRKANDDFIHYISVNL
ncbi:neutral cholesterol ester hydrolase 1-like [Glandiceps talaboti]